MASIMRNKLLALVAVWFYLVVTVVADSTVELGNMIDDRAALEGAVYVEPGLLPRDEHLTVTVTDTVCATQSPGIPPTTLITAPQPPATVTPTSVTGPAPTSQKPPVSSESHGGHTTGTAPEASTMSTVQHTETPGPSFPPSTSVSPGSQSSTHASSQTTGPALPSTSPVTSVGHSSSHPVSSQTTESASTGTAPSSSHSSTAPPLSNDASAQGGMKGALLALGLTFVGFLAV
ncbi:hypothetical protein P170DRAFT_462727 [Aspergillus steynii IBT 23096]|uniref:Cell wall protein n=1 Tax=Aspergillus steynii IBT 23096 TaxID=1392250 RepID=A0A2I2GJ43_9EURO|nr:uncharacterized protein P170DRAFT_462727 [Aspergillus steynii IBT 23096]PLB52896.1 hypothetical protein P170DRAFT_462727 [Aspergillus steynii IBT 23096]